MKKSFILPLALSVTVGLGSPEVLRPLSFKDLKRVGAVGDSDRTAKEPRIENVDVTDSNKAGLKINGENPFIGMKDIQPVKKNVGDLSCYTLVMFAVADLFKKAGFSSVGCYWDQIKDLQNMATEEYCKRLLSLVELLCGAGLERYAKVVLQKFDTSFGAFTRPYELFEESSFSLSDPVLKKYIEHSKKVIRDYRGIANSEFKKTFKKDMANYKFPDSSVFYLND